MAERRRVARRVGLAGAEAHALLRAGRALGCRLRRSGPRALSEALSPPAHDGVSRFARNRRAAIRAVARFASASAGRAPAARALGEAAIPARLLAGRLRRRTRGL